MFFPLLPCTSHTWCSSWSLPAVYHLPRHSLIFSDPSYFSVFIKKGDNDHGNGQYPLGSCCEVAQWSSSELLSGQSCSTYLCCSHSWLPREKTGKQTAWKKLAAAHSSPQPQDSHKVFLQWEYIFGTFLPGSSSSLLTWHHLPHNCFPQLFTGRTVCLDL